MRSDRDLKFFAQAGTFFAKNVCRSTRKAKLLAATRTSYAWTKVDASWLSPMQLSCHVLTRRLRSCTCVSSRSLRLTRLGLKDSKVALFATSKQLSTTPTRRFFGVETRSAVLRRAGSAKKKYEFRFP